MQPTTRKQTKLQRLKGNEVFRRVIEQRNRAYDRCLSIYVSPNGRSFSRLGIRVGRHVGNAFKRSKVRRRIREAFRRNAERIPVGLDVICIARTGKAMTYQSICKSMINLTTTCQSNLR